MSKTTTPPIDSDEKGDRAAELIDSDDQEWYDFCANHGHLPDNVEHMPSVRRAFARWLEGEE